MINHTINKDIKTIGRNCYCTESELREYLPSSHPFGGEYIFRIGHANAHRYIDSEVEYFIKGLHFIEMKYKELNSQSRDDYGFGSPSPTAKVIDALEKRDPKLAKKLRNWVYETGGNYYIR